MMNKGTSSFVCQACGAVAGKWAGRCDNCGAWNTIVEEAPRRPVSGGKGASLPKGRSGELVGLKGDSARPGRGSRPASPNSIGWRAAASWPGSGVLIGGDPGIGKSTLLLQALAALARSGANGSSTVSGEEAIAQVRLRAERLGLADAPVLLASVTNVSDILATLNDMKPPAVVVIDSIQTLWSPVIEASPGTVSQLRGRLGSPDPLRQAEGHRPSCWSAM